MNLPSKFVAFLFLALSLKSAAQDSLNPCVRAQSFHIVVLGSSTAAGAGPSSPDSAWVNRYRAYLQQIHPQNQVTNLAVGGTNTYKIMPDWFTPPAGRPATNPAKNVTQAISLGADAIIVNMPSNDASAGYDVNEQMTNFITISQSADSTGIPVWICTTQPRNFPPSKIQIQINVRDSVLSYFGNFAIDFWSGFADSTNQPKTIFDSGDGVHLNDAAHRILFERVAAKNILSTILDTGNAEDFATVSLDYSGDAICGDSLAQIQLSIVNLGAASSLDLPIRWEITDLKNNTFQTHFDTLFNGLSSCKSDTFKYFLNTAVAGKWEVRAILLTQNDSILENDTSQILTIKSDGRPQIFTENDSVCFDEKATLFAQGGDTIFWYDLVGKNIAFGDSLFIDSLQNSQLFFARAIKGDLHFNKSLKTRESTNINWNGVMFDLFAKDTLTIDSLALKIFSTGNQQVTAHFKTGGYLDFENDAVAWTLWGSDSVNVSAAGNFHNVNFGTKNLLPNDTLGVYLHLQNGGTLSYHSVPQPATHADSRLEITSGTGISHTFTDSFFPRDWAGEIFYHHGFNPNGDCSVTKKVLAAVRPQPIVNLGVDTILPPSLILVLDGGAGFSDYDWNTGDSTRFLTLDTSKIPLDSNVQIILKIEDANGCVGFDTISVLFSSTFSIENITEKPAFDIFPNPNDGTFYIKGEFSENADLKIFDTSGREVFQQKIIESKFKVEHHLPQGIYSILIQNDENFIHRKMSVH